MGTSVDSINPDRDCLWEEYAGHGSRPSRGDHTYNTREDSTETFGQGGGCRVLSMNCVLNCVLAHVRSNAVVSTWKNT